MRHCLACNSAASTLLIHALTYLHKMLHFLAVTNGQDVRRRRGPVPAACVTCETEPKQSFEIITWARSADAQEHTYASRVSNVKRHRVITLARSTHAAALEAKTLVETETAFKVTASATCNPLRQRSIWAAAAPVSWSFTTLNLI